MPAASPWPSRLRRAGLALGTRLLLGAALLGIYFYVWGPHGRAAYLQSVARPVLTATAPTSWTVSPKDTGPRLSLQSPAPGRSVTLTSPAGVRFLLPALGLVLLTPSRLYWLWLWMGHIALGLVGLGALAIGLQGLSGGFMLYDMTTSYLVDAFSLGVSVLAVHAEFDLKAPRAFPSGG